MLKELTIQNFKCFNSVSLPMAPLTLLTGFNAAGKSTTLQSLLLLSQSMRSGNRTAELPLNGNLVRLGTPGEVINSGSGNILFSVKDENVEIEWTLEAEDRTKGIALKIPKIKISGSGGTADFEDIDSLNMLLPLNSAVNYDAVHLAESLYNLIFLSAVRMGTSDVFPSPEDPSPVHADVGEQGEYAPWWFQKFLDEEIEATRCHPSDSAKTFRRQVNAWASVFFPNAQCNALTVEKTNLVRLELRIGDTDDWRRPANIGYGLTYAFPVLVAGLLAKPEQILIIDSPEAHLHPQGQSQMGYFLATVAASGVQVLIETHSDHILNGVRRAIGEQKILRPDDAIAYFYDMKKPSPKKLSFTETGSIEHWPPGFFDQYQLDIRALTKVRRPR